MSQFLVFKVVLFKFSCPVCNFLSHRLTFPLPWASLWFTPTDFSSFCNYPHASRLHLAQFSCASDSLFSVFVSLPSSLSSRCDCMQAFPDAFTFFFFVKAFYFAFFHNHFRFIFFPGYCALPTPAAFCSLTSRDTHCHTLSTWATGVLMLHKNHFKLFCNVCVWVF